MDPSALNILSLCSGAGMLDIGLAAALARYGIRARTVAYSEREAAPCAVLRSRMEDKDLEPAPIWSGNLEDFPAAGFHGVVDGIAAGFPCQPHSVAGQRKGREDERNLLPAILNVADATGAWVLFLENVSGLKKEFDYITNILLQRGWDLEWGTLRASDVGASHRRDRWFCMAYRQHLPGGAKRQLESRRWEITGPADRSMSGAAGAELLADNERGCFQRPGRPGELVRACAAHEGGVGSEQRNAADGCRCELLAHGQREGLEGHGWNGRDRDQSGRIMPEPSGSTPENGHELEHAEGNDERRMPLPAMHGEGEPAGGSGGKLGNSHGSGCEWARSAESTQWLSDSEPSWASLPVFAPGPADPSWSGILDTFPWLAPALPDEALRIIGDRLARRDAVEAESVFCELADGLAPDVVRSRADMLRIAGNGVVPWQAECAFTQLLARILDTAAL